MGHQWLSSDKPTTGRHDLRASLSSASNSMLPLLEFGKIVLPSRWHNSRLTHRVSSLQLFASVSRQIPRLSCCIAKMKYLLVSGGVISGIGKGTSFFVNKSHELKVFRVGQ